MKKTKSIIILTIIMLVNMIPNALFAWIAIEFIIFLAKDDPFNWWSVFAFSISLIVAITLAIFMSAVKAKNDKSINNLKRH